MGFFIHNKLLDIYEIKIISKDLDGIIVIALTDKVSSYSILFKGVYIPPENTTSGRQGENFYENLTNLIYENCDYDCTIIVGDFNSRISKYLDYIENVDKVPERVCLDETDNNHGNLMIDCLLKGKLCVVNGLICPLNDSYTCVSHKGKSVVDFVICAHEKLKQIQYFKVLPVNEALVSMNLQVEAVGQVSDHAML